MVLGNAHSSNRRKFDTYRNIDKLSVSTPIIALPVLSKESGKQASDRVQGAQVELYRSMGLTMSDTTEVLDETVSREVLESVIGGDLVDINDLLRGK